MHTETVVEMRTRRVFLPDARDNDQYLRATWHPDTAVVVMSHWVGDVCVASTPVGVAQLSTLINLLVAALHEAANTAAEVPTTADSPTPGPTSAILERLNRHIRPRLAQIIAIRRRPTGGDVPAERDH